MSLAIGWKRYSLSAFIKNTNLITKGDDQLILSKYLQKLQNNVAGQLSWYSDWLRAGRSGYRIPVRARFSAPVQTGPGAHPASCTMGTWPFPGVKRGRGITLTPHPLLVPWSRKGRAIPLLPLWAVRPVQSLSTCTRVTFSFYLFKNNVSHYIIQILVTLYVITKSWVSHLLIGCG